MKLHELTVITDPDDPSKITQARFVVADHPDPEQRKEWISGQVSVDAQTVLNGALLRSKVLCQARDTLDQLAKNFEHLGREYFSDTQDQS